MLVSRGSQFHHDPHIDLAQMEPVTVAAMQNRKPSSAAAAAWSSRLRSRRHR